jgi:(+)-neomenthol dehydrogenase
MFVKFLNLLMSYQRVCNEWAKGVLSDADKLTEERIDEVLREFIKDFEEGSLERKGWPRHIAAILLLKPL